MPIYKRVPVTQALFGVSASFLMGSTQSGAGGTGEAGWPSLRLPYDQEDRIRSWWNDWRAVRR
ncbi:MAG: hypothetical protein ACLQUY_18655 [Ktedonobacterales bacterium]